MKKLELQHIRLANFKNYTFQELEFDDKLNCLVGNNGMGKTNLLDAVHYICYGKSKFQASDKLLMLHDSDFFRLEGQFLLDTMPEKVVAKVSRKKKKQFERNDVAYEKLSQHIGHFPVVFIAPDDVYLIREGSEERRRFMDNILSQLNPAYLQALIHYNKTLKQRNALLKSWKEHPNNSLLEIYSEQLLAPGKLIHDCRKVFVEQFNPLLQSKYEVISNQGESVSMAYHSALNEEDFKALLKQAREKDIILQRSSVGTHKDDLKFSIEGFPLKQFGSQGQLKSFLLSLKLTEYYFLKQEKQIMPILILDDIFDKLDQDRIERLIQLIGHADFGQIFISDTHQNRLQNIAAKIGLSVKNFKIVDGSAKLF